MKHYMKLLSLVLVAGFLMAGTSAPAAAGFDKGPVTYTSGINIMVYGGNNFAPESDVFAANFERAGNTYTFVDLYDFDANLATDNPDALIMPRTHNILNAANLTAIATWFAMGEKLLWIGGESDFAGYYWANNTHNPLLSEIGSQLRLFSGSIEDPQSNDQSAYRVAVNETGVSSPMTDYVTADFGKVIMHGPTAILYEESGSGLYKDLRNATLGTGDLTNVNILLNTSAAAIALDSDLSFRTNGSDFYSYSSVTGNYPMLATDMVGTSMAVLSGESITTDYKFMNGDTTENDRDQHNGSVIIARVFAWFFTEVNGFDSVDIYEDYETETVTDTLTETETETETEIETNVVTQVQTNVVTSNVNVPTTVKTTVTQTNSEGKSPVDPLMIFLGITAAGAIGLIARRRY
jgi:hypothetical protein